MHGEINIRRSHCYVNSSENTFIHVPIATLYSDLENRYNICGTNRLFCGTI